MSLCFPDYEQLDSEIDRLRRGLKTKVDNLRHLEGDTKSTRAFDLQPLTKEDLQSVEGLLWSASEQTCKQQSFVSVFAGSLTFKNIDSKYSTFFHWNVIVCVKSCIGLLCYCYYDLNILIWQIYNKVVELLLHIKWIKRHNMNKNKSRTTRSNFYDWTVHCAASR